jgi:membrane protein implicated in regulation of membrane protease activity
MSSRPPTDLRKQRAALNRSLFALVLCVLVLGGGAMFALVYEPGAAILGVLCLSMGAGVVGLIWAIFSVIEKWVSTE